MIVACPGCDSRYDVTGRPPGTRAKCRCGTVFNLPRPQKEAATLACPKCGGNVKPTNHKCEFCTAALMVKACPRCFAKIFAGHKHCHSCGYETMDPARALEDGRAAPLECPRCDVALEAKLVGDVLLDECTKCHGVFIDKIALEKTLTDRRQARAQAVLGGVKGGEAPPAPHEQERMYIRCPECEEMMNRRLFATGSGVIVDVCRHHGTWFDPNELPKVIEFTMKGGLEQAAVKDANKARRAAKDALHKARHEKAASARAKSRGEFNDYGSLLDALTSWGW